MEDPDKPASRSSLGQVLGARRAAGFASLGGAEAYSAPLILVSSAAAGFFGGTWLDGHFHTAVWMPLLTIGGVVAGFVEMIRTLLRVARRNTFPSGGPAQPSGREQSRGSLGQSSRSSEAAPPASRYGLPEPPLPGSAMTAPEAEDESAGESGAASGGYRLPSDLSENVERIKELLNEERAAPH